MKRTEILQEYVEEYKPIVEKLSGVEIGDVKIKPRIQLADDFYNLKNRNLLDKYLIKLGLFLMKYTSDFATFGKDIYDCKNNSCKKKREVTGIVHELFHIAQEKINKFDGMPERLKIRLKEGYAEYSSLVEFLPYYGLNGIEEEAESSKQFLSRRILECALIYEGFNFFEECAKHLNGKSLTEIIKNPPKNIYEFWNVKKYLERLENGN